MISQFYLLFVATLCFLQPGNADRLIIEKIECKRVASGVAPWARESIGALGSLVSIGSLWSVEAGALIVCPEGSVATIPMTVAAVGGAAAAGNTAAKKALAFLESGTSGTDDLVVYVNGHKVYPHSSATHGSMSPGDVIEDMSVDFAHGAEIQLIEYDWGSHNDDLGSIYINSDAMDAINPGKGYRVDQAILMSEEEGSLYFVTYRVERDTAPIPDQWMLCGTTQCKECSEPMCTNTNSDELDRDGDKPDLKNCPYPMIFRGYKKWPMYWPLDDLYCRICSSPGASTE